MPPPLHLERRSYSWHPWRIVHTPSGKELADASFLRKRDGVPVLAALLALDAPWDVPWSEWPAEVLEAARVIVAACPGAVVRRRAFGEHLRRP